MRTRRSPRNQMVLWRAIDRSIEEQARKNPENPMPRLARKYPLTRREPVTETPCDRTFASALKVHDSAWEKVRSASATCLYSVARQLFTASQHFDASDTELRTFRSELARGLADRDFIVIGHAVRQFLAGIDRTKIDFADESSVEAALVHAVVNYQDALEAWSRDDHKASHPLTVMCRSSLNRIGD